MNVRLIVATAVGIALTACGGNRDESVRPGTPQPGAGAGQRGGLNDGNAAGDIHPAPGDSGSPSDRKSNTTK
jgi:hypothetical protein